MFHLTDAIKNEQFKMVFKLGTLVADPNSFAEIGNRLDSYTEITEVVNIKGFSSGKLSFIC